MDNNCFGATCKSLTTQADSLSGSCAVKNTVAETTEGCKCSPRCVADGTLMLAVGLKELPGGGMGA
jgi:hypothetical protein